MERNTRDIVISRLHRGKVQLQIRKIPVRPGPSWTDSNISSDICLSCRERIHSGPLGWVHQNPNCDPLHPPQTVNGPIGRSTEDLIREDAKIILRDGLKPIARYRGWEPLVYDRTDDLADNWQ